MKTSSLCLVLFAAVVGLAGCQSSSDSNASTPSDLSNMDIDTNLPFSGQTLSAQQISDMNRICRPRRVSMSTQDHQDQNNFERSEISSRGRDFDRSSCAMSASDSTTYQYQVGTYRSRSRGPRQTAAVRQITQVSGIIMCNGRPIGHGLMTQDQIFSAKLINAGQTVYCKDDEIYSATTLRLDNGTVVSSTRPQIQTSNGGRSDIR